MRGAYYYLLTALLGTALVLTACGSCKTKAHHCVGLRLGERSTSPTPPRRITRPQDGGVMVLIPRGSFMMGREREDLDPGNDVPQHEVHLSKDYYLDIYEVTCAQWALFLRSTGYDPEGDPERSRPNDPVSGVSHGDAQAYARCVGCTLPSEAQWERAARGGIVGQAFPWGAADVVTCRNGLGGEDGYEGVAPVGSFPPNSFGLFDMIGNVEEWCADGFVPHAHLAIQRIDPSEPEAWQFVVRGGSWYESGLKLRTSYRQGRRDLLDEIGFRCCRVSTE